jgi:uncharacterized protein YqcC (DUF446 family)
MGYSYGLFQWVILNRMQWVAEAAHAWPHEGVYHANMAAAALKIKEYQTALQVSA